MKKIFISLTLLISLSFVAIVATSMTEASIYIGDNPFGCIGCGECWNTYDVFSENEDNGLACWGEYQTGTAFDMVFYTYPAPEHWEAIENMEEMCPVKAIVHY